MHRAAFQCPIRIGCLAWSKGVHHFDLDPRRRNACSSRPLSVTGSRRWRVSCNLERPPRAASGWYRSLQSLPRSRVLFNVWPQVATAFVGSCIVVVLHALLQHALGDGYDVPPLSPTPHTFLATALGLVLVFRTNAAYDRYWEGRKIWGGIVNTGRNMARLVTLNMTPLNARLSSILIVCYAHSLAQRLQLSRSDEPCQSLLAGESEELAVRITNAANKPLECIVALGQIVRDDMLVKEVRHSDQRANTMVERTALESCIGELMDHLGACERICSTPVPLSYSRHTTRLLSLFLITLPLVLVGQPGGTFYTVPSVVFVTWALSGIDEVAHLIEDPFLGLSVSLQLGQICAKIQRDVLEQVASSIQK